MDFLERHTDFTLGGLYNFKNKELAKRRYMKVWLKRTQQIFKWDGLPDTIPQNMLELYLQLYGHCVFVEKDDDVYVCFGNWGGEPNPYYIPSKYVVANPYLDLNKVYTIGVDCVLAKNDSLYDGLYELLSRYTSLMCESDISLLLALYNSRVVSVISAQDDSTFESAKKFLVDIEEGKLSPITAQAFIESLNVSPYGTGARAEHITDLIELTQYLKASLFNDLGLNANYNMKRESINSGEAQLNDDMLLPLIDDMLECRIKVCEEVNNMFGLDLSVGYNSAWKDNEEELKAEQNAISDKSEGDEGVNDELSED